MTGRWDQGTRPGVTDLKAGAKRGLVQPMVKAFTTGCQATACSARRRGTSPNSVTGSPNIRKRTRKKGRAGSLPQKRACHQPVQQSANQQAHAAQVEEAGVVVGHANALAANRMPHGKRRKLARTVTVPTCCVTSISGLSMVDEVRRASASASRQTLQH